MVERNGISDGEWALLATRSPVLSEIRVRVPAFEEAFQRANEEEDRLMGSFQAMSVFAEWLTEQMRVVPESADVTAAVAVIEDIASATAKYESGHDLIIEFVEVVRDLLPGDAHRLGPNTRRWF